MKKTKDKITALLNAITFAESGEHETAVEYLEQASPPVGAEVSTEHADPGFVAKKTRSLRQRLEEHLTAMAFAEAGDFRSAGEMLEVPEKQRTVLLAIEGEEPDPASFNYAASLCRRLDARMSVLVIAEALCDEAETERIGALCKRLEGDGISVNIETIQGESNKYLVDYAKHHKEIVTVVYDSPKTRQRSSESKAWQRIAEELSNKLSIPLVTVLSKQHMGTLA
jgi:hypothetical protein